MDHKLACFVFNFCLAPEFFAFHGHRVLQQVVNWSRFTPSLAYALQDLGWQKTVFPFCISVPGKQK